jgi:uncharacterized protein YutE (UPF0331/DUF86 family)
MEQPLVTKKVIRVKKIAAIKPSDDALPVDTLVVSVPVAKKTIKKKVSKPQVTKPQKEEEKPTCDICLEPYNKIANTEVKCGFCEKSACRRCIQIFFTSTTNDPHCMHCNKLWEREFVDDNLTMTYRMNEYKKHRENVLLDREVALMPATQHRAEQIRSADKMEIDIIKPFNNQLRILAEEEIAIRRKTSTIQNLRMDALYQINLLRTGQADKGKTKPEVTFIRKCPDSDCRGFLSTAWKCGLCSKWACPECHELKGDNRDAEHTCNPDNVATAKLLAKDSRPCPGCATVITKIEGCDQMWCPQCHTPFSWRTGRKETGVVHNPHFYEWQRKQNGGVAPRVAGDIACGGVPHYAEVRAALTGLLPKESEHITNFHRVLNHVQHVDLTRYHNVFNEADNEDLRIQYLLGNINADTLKLSVQAKEKKREKERAVRRALEVLVQAGIDILRRIMSITSIEKISEKRAIIEELDALRIYVNELLARVNQRMKLSVHQYKSNWETHNPFTLAGQRRDAYNEALIKASEERRRLAVAERERLNRPILANLARPPAIIPNPV